MFTIFMIAPYIENFKKSADLQIAMKLTNILQLKQTKPTVDYFKFISISHLDSKGNSSDLSPTTPDEPDSNSVQPLHEDDFVDLVDKFTNLKVNDEMVCYPITQTKVMK